jgi:hypothetical protein
MALLLTLFLQTLHGNFPEVTPKEASTIDTIAAENFLALYGGGSNAETIDKR